MTKWQLFQAFAERKHVQINDTLFSVVESIEHEDGSGHCFNVTGYVMSACVPNRKRTVFVRTID